jgi:hypothetical protein
MVHHGVVSIEKPAAVMALDVGRIEGKSAFSSGVCSQNLLSFKEDDP